MERAAHDLRAQGCATFEHPFDMLQPARALLRRRPDRVHVDAWNDANTRRLEAETLEMAAKLGVFSGGAFEHRNFDAVIAGALDVFENRPVFGLDVRCPQEQVETDLHDVPSQKVSHRLLLSRPRSRISRR